ncbi:hypothetical protein [Ornithinimicrobium flavum]|uniref:hypothetical protein n=1 Tax=Ornithinimicrobium flavum TaxID=1288636 RepID=UPI00107022E4|nr:hypothetical protein [Ornithinimicrobium flavum]
MSEHHAEGSAAEVDAARQEAAEHVVERVESWDEGARPETVKDDLREGMSQAGVEVDDANLDRMAGEIHDRGSTETPEVG